MSKKKWVPYRAPKITPARGGNSADLFTVATYKSSKIGVGVHSYDVAPAEGHGPFVTLRTYRTEADRLESMPATGVLLTFQQAEELVEKIQAVLGERR